MTLKLDLLIFLHPPRASHCRKCGVRLLCKEPNGAFAIDEHGIVRSTASYLMRFFLSDRGVELIERNERTAAQFFGASPVADEHCGADCDQAD